MNLSFRKPRPLDRTIPHLRDTRLIVIATEGECTERQYFELFREQSTRVQILVLETRDGHSAPKHLFERLLRFKRDHNLIKGDQLWLVLDKDRWQFAPYVGIATERARSLDLSPTDRWPNTLGTHVYRVIEAIKELTKN